MHLSSRRPFVTAVPSALALPRRAVGRSSRWRASPAGVPAVLLLVLVATAATIVVAQALRAPSFGDLEATAGCALLFAAAEALAIRLEIRETRVELALRATPLLMGLAFATPGGLAAAVVLGTGAGLAVRRVPAREALARVAAALLGTTGAVLAFALVREFSTVHVLAWWVAGSGAAVLLAVACALPAALGVGRPGQAPSRAAVGYAGLAAAVDASLAMTVVIFLRTEPSELWLLAGPVAVGVAGLRALGAMRRRQARIELLYACSQLLDGAADGTAMLAEVLERVRVALRAQAAELVVDGVAEVPLRVAVDGGGGVEPLAGVARATLDARRALLPRTDGSAILRSGRAAGGERLVDGVLAGFERPGRVSGVVSAAGRTDGSPFGADDRALLESLAALLADALAGDRLVEELRATRADLQRLAALVAGSDDAIVGVSTDGTVTSWNPAAEALFGQPASDVVGRPAALLVEEGRQAIAAAYARACAGELTRDVGFDARRPDGTVVSVAATVSPVRGPGGVEGVSVIARDQTSRTLADTLLRERLDRFERVFEGSAAGMGVVGPDFRWLRANEALARMLHATPETLVGRRFELAIARDDIEPAHGLVSRTLRAEVEAGAVEVGLRTRPRTDDADEARAAEPTDRADDARPGHDGAPDRGATTFARLSVRSLHATDDGRQVLVTVEDITERRATEARARAAKARVQAAVLALTRIREPEEVLRSAVRAAREATGAEAALITLPDGGGWGRQAWLGEDDGSGLLEAVAEGERLLLLTGGRRTVRLPGPGTGHPFTTARLRSFVSVPVDLEDGTAGVLVLANRHDAPAFDDDDVALAEALATQAGLSLANARAHERALALVRELDRANARLTEAGAAKARFLANVSHELRSPLHSILLAAGLLASPEAGRDPGRLRSLPATIEGSSRYLLRLIEDLIDLSRMEVSELRVEPVEVELAPILAEVRHQLAGLAEERGLGLAFPASCRVRLHADPLRLRQVLVNLGANAIKYTPPGGRVRFGVRSAGGAVRIAVSDTGVGIAPEDLERVFEPFERLARDDAPGAGLGLPIARRIAELHGGTLAAAPRPGGGSVFTVTLPAMAAVRGDSRAAGSAAAPPRRDAPAIAGGAPRATGGGAPRATGGAASPRVGPSRRAAAPAPIRERPLVLVVDDDGVGRDLTAQVLRDAGHDVETAGSLDDARRRLSDAASDAVAGPPALLLVDLRLGGEDGLELVREARGAVPAHLPIVTFSAGTGAADESLALAAGASRHLRKPIDGPSLVAELDALLRREGEPPVRLAS